MLEGRSWKLCIVCSVENERKTRLQNSNCRTLPNLLNHPLLRIEVSYSGVGVRLVVEGLLTFFWPRREHRGGQMIKPEQWKVVRRNTALRISLRILVKFGQ